MRNSATQTTPSASTKCTKSKPKTQHEKEVALLKVAASWEGETKKSIIEALRANGLAGNPANVERVQELSKAFSLNRRMRLLNRVNTRVTERLDTLPRLCGQPAVQLPRGMPAQRLTNLRKSTITTLAKATFRHGAPGGTDFIVEFAASSSEVNYSVSLNSNYDVYRGSFKGWAANADIHRIRVPLNWRLRVQRKGLALLGGMLTLDARPLEAPNGIDLYAAVWASQGRGYDVKTQRGFIAVAGPESFHAETPEAAIAGLLRKCKTAEKNRATMADMASSVETFITNYSNYAIEVSLDDARKSGSCEYGIRSWCESVGIELGREHVPMPELLEAFRRMPQTEVRRAVLHAVRRNRRACRGQ